MVVIELVPQAADDYLALDNSVRLEVRKAFRKLQMDPRHYGEPLGNKAGIELYGWFSIRAGRRIRVIYSIAATGAGDEQVIIRSIGRRERFLAHQDAKARLREYAEATREELIQLDALVETAEDR